MQPDTPPFSTKPTPPRSSALRYALALTLLVAAIGGIAWVAQFLPSWNKKKERPGPPPPVAALLNFPRTVAQWDNKKPEDEESGDPLQAKEKHVPKEFEFGAEGHYDFPFKNISGEEVELVQFLSDCDCTNVQVCAVPMAEWTKLAEQQRLKPGDPLTYTSKPAWQELQNSRQQAAKAQETTVLKVKPDEGGVVRILWTVKKTPGQTLKLTPHIVFRKTGEQIGQAQTLAVPVLVGMAIRFEPPRSDRLYLEPSSKSDAAPAKAKAEFDVWSSTREKFDLKLTTVPPNPFFDIQIKRFSAEECAALGAKLKTENSTLRVRSGHHVTVTVSESKDGKQLDQGPFYQKLLVHLDGVEERELPGPEIVGLVRGDIRIGGADDWGKIRFKQLLAGETTTKEVVLLADAKVQLETYTHEPAWMDVKVTRNKEQLDPKQHSWRLRVTVPANTPGVRSFVETDHVTLRIVGPPERFVRIAIEGSLGGQ